MNQTNISTPHLLVLLAGIYTLQSTIGAITFQGLPAVLRSYDYGTDTIGFVYLLMLPWVIKFLWAPAGERYRRSTPSANRRLLMVGVILQVVFLVLLAGADPGFSLVLLIAILLLLALTASAVDNAGDGFAIDQLARQNLGFGNTIQIGGGYLGAMLGGGAFLMLVDNYNWSIAVGAIAVIALLVIFPIDAIPEHTSAPSTATMQRPTLRAALRRPMLMGIGIVLIYQCSLRLVQGMMMPFLVDQGVSLTELGFIVTFGNSIASLFAVVVIGAVLRRLSPYPVMWVCLLLQLPVYLAFYYVSTTEQSSLSIASTLLISQAMISAAAFVALYTAMMGWAKGSQSGVNFAIFQCADTAIAMCAGVASGLLVAWLGYSVFFALAVGIAILALFALPVLLRRQPREAL
ncbi:MAG: MFS transporter [Pseudomonadota bacterium]